MSAKHRANTPIDAYRHRGKSVPDDNGEPSCSVCGWSPGPEDVKRLRESERTSVSRMGAVTIIYKLHPDLRNRSTQ